MPATQAYSWSGSMLSCRASSLAHGREVSVAVATRRPSRVEPSEPGGVLRVPSADAELGLVGEPALVLHREGEAGDVGAEPVHDLPQHRRLDQPGLHDALGVQVVDERAVGADRQAAVVHRGGHGVHPPRRPSGDEDEDRARLLHAGERGERAGRHGAVRSERGAVQIGGDESRSAHSTFQSALLAVNVQFCTINYVDCPIRGTASRAPPEAAGDESAARREDEPATPCTPPARRAAGQDRWRARGPGRVTARAAGMPVTWGEVGVDPAIAGRSTVMPHMRARPGGTGSVQRNPRLREHRPRGWC